jgi:threonine dehydratase
MLSPERTRSLEVHYGNVLAAYGRIKHAAIRTPIFTSTALDKIVGAQCSFKGEHMQKVGAFKFRGAMNAISQLNQAQKSRGVITHSSGNHAQAVALAANMLGVAATIVMPDNAPAVKVAATKGYGARIIKCAPTERQSTTDKLVAKEGYTFIHPSNNMQVIYGQGTAVLEMMLDAQHNFDVMFLPIGGGGLIGGSSIAVKGHNPRCRVIGVEPAGADDAFRSIRDGQIYPSVQPKTIADGLRTSLGNNNFPLIQKFVDEILLVSEHEIVDAMQLIYERLKCVIEPSGAVAFAGALQYREKLQVYY